MLGFHSKEIYVILLCGTLIALAFVFQPSSAGQQAELFSTYTSGTALKASRAVLFVKKPSNVGAYNLGKEGNTFNPTVDPSAGNPAQLLPALAALLPSLLIPVAGIVVLVAVLRFFRKPILRFLGAVPVEDEQMYRPPPYGSPFGSFPPYGGQYSGQYSGQYGQYGGQGNPYGQPPSADAEAAFQQLLQNATPEQAAKLREIQQSMQSTSPSPSPAARPGQWVTPEPIPANAGETLTPEEKRERARQKARSMAQAQMQDDVRRSTDTWVDRQTQAEKAVVAENPWVQPDEREAAVASLVLLSFVLTQAGFTG